MIAKQEQVIASYFTQYRLLIEVGLTQGANVTACSFAEHALKLCVRAESVRRIHDLRIETGISIKYLDRSDNFLTYFRSRLEELQCWWDMKKSSRIQA
jgi:hypothetical protein